MTFQFDIKTIYPPGTDYVVDTAKTNFSKVSGSILYKDFDSEIYRFAIEYDAVFGVVAWMKDMRILKSLRETNTSILIQKDTSSQKVMDAYSKLKNKYLFRNVDGLSKYRSKYTPSGHPCNSSIDTVRLVGVLPQSKNVHSYPRCHDKFLVFYKEEKRGIINFLVPKAVWVGSFNFTYNASIGFDSVVVIDDAKVAKLFHNKFVRIYGISEPLSNAFSEDMDMEFSVDNEETTILDTKTEETIEELESISCTMTEKRYLRNTLDYKSIKISECSKLIRACPGCGLHFCANHLLKVSEWFTNTAESDEFMCIKCATKYMTNDSVLIGGHDRIVY